MYFAKKKNPTKVNIIYGAPASGKSTYVKDKELERIRKTETIQNGG